MKYKLVVKLFLEIIRLKWELSEEKEYSDMRTKQAVYASDKLRIVCDRLKIPYTQNCNVTEVDLNYKDFETIVDEALCSFKTNRLF